MTGSFSFLLIVFLYLSWTLHISPVWILLLGWVRFPFRCLLSLRCRTLPSLSRIRVSAACIAQIPHIQQSLLQVLHKLCWACLWALVETGHREEDVVWPGVVADPVSVLDHRSVAAEHLHGGGDLRGEIVHREQFKHWNPSVTAERPTKWQRCGTRVILFLLFNIKTNRWITTGL